MKFQDILCNFKNYLFLIISYNCHCYTKYLNSQTSSNRELSIELKLQVIISFDTNLKYKSKIMHEYIFKDRIRRCIDSKRSTLNGVAK